MGEIDRARRLGQDRARDRAGTCHRSGVTMTWHWDGMDGTTTTWERTGPRRRAPLYFAVAMRIVLFVLVLFLVGVWCLDAFRTPMTFLSCSGPGVVVCWTVSSTTGNIATTLESAKHVSRCVCDVLNPSQIVSRLTFLISSLITRLIQSFIQNITFLLCIGLLIKVLQK